MDKAITTLNKIGTNLLAIVVLACGMTCFALKEREGGLLLVGGGLTLLKTRAEHETPAQS